MKARLHFLVVLCLLTVIGYGQKLKINSGKIAQSNYYEVIDFELVNEKIKIPVTINNKVYYFMLDTGAPNLISKRVADDINLQNKTSIVTTDANNNKSTLEMGALESIKLGTLDFQDNVVLISDLDNHPLLKCYKIDGLIGSNFFKNSILKISLKERKIWVTDKIKNLNIKTPASKLSLIGEQQSPYIPISFLNDSGNKGSEHLMIDTGMDGFYEISKRVYKLIAKEKFFKELSSSSGSGSVGLFGASTEKEQFLLQTNYFKVNETVFSNVITTTTEDNNSRIGFDLLKHGDITLDFKNKKFYFESNPNITLSEKVPVYAATFMNNKLSVGFVWSSSYRNQLNYGDEIVRMGNYTLSELDLCDILKLKNFRKENPSYEMEIKTKENKTVLIKIEN
ncbi:retroviral-like aspartic protease family protein [Flavobacterium sp. SM15]|uniref:retropepsin-like aspartic protease n=1 Tax=Flavobacterium sp. SM15 TaxID=2908005 RepID=UPI001EDC3C0C|nr:retropepsin-like aspartic protease [Flavobacterium sp. SM15]MCG2611664.1 retroviral-like aspartic protease family protein [Flavobacterium sp. SM15]